MPNNQFLTNEQPTAPFRIACSLRLPNLSTQSIWLILGWTVVCAGNALRITAWLWKKSFWLDELLIIHNITNRTILQLFRPLSGNQSAPPLFLVAVKLATAILGVNEYACRLTSMVCAVTSVLLMWKLLSRLLEARVAAIAMVLFSFAAPLIYYAAETKQYSTELFATLLLLICAENLYETKSQKSVLILWAAGAFALLTSLPSVFVLASLGIAIGIEVIRGTFKRLVVLQLGLSAFLWTLELVLLWVFILRYTSANTYFYSYWSNGLMPRPVGLTSLFWFGRVLRDMCGDVLGIYGNVRWSLLLLLMFAGGAALSASSVFRTVLIAGPIILCLSAASLRVYPFSHRLIVFLSPCLIILFGQGLNVFNRFSRKTVGMALGIVVAGFVLFPTLLMAPHAYKPSFNIDTRAAFKLIATEKRPDDVVWVYGPVADAFHYYADSTASFQTNNVITANDLAGVEGRVRLHQSLDELRNKRAWIVVGMDWVYDRRDLGEIQSYLEHFGHGLTRRDCTNVTVFFYDAS